MMFRVTMILLSMLQDLYISWEAATLKAEWCWFLPAFRDSRAQSCRVRSVVEVKVNLSKRFPDCCRYYVWCTAVDQEPRLERE